jgi:hypothetical protein
VGVERERESEKFHDDDDGQNLKYVLIKIFENRKSILEIRSL